MRGDDWIENGQDIWYIDWTWEVEVVYMGRKLVFLLYKGRIDGILTGKRDDALTGLGK